MLGAVGIHSYVNNNLVMFSFLDFLKPLGFPFSHWSNVADVNALGDVLIFLLVIQLVAALYIIRRSEKQKQTKA